MLLRHPAGALNEFQMVKLCPLYDIGFPHEIKRANQFHSGKVCAMQFGHHRLRLRTIEHPHENAEILGCLVQMSPPHSGTEIAGMPFLLIYHLENPRLKCTQRQL